MDAGLSPFVSQFVVYSGKVGSSVDILGQGFSNATGVKFGTGAGTFVASGASFDDARLQLVAGDVNRVSEQRNYALAGAMGEVLAA